MGTETVVYRTDNRVIEERNEKAKRTRSTELQSNV